MLKLYRAIEGGINPDLELGRFLTERGFPHVPAVAGSIEYRGAESSTAAILQQFVPNEGDLFRYILDQVSTFLERAATRAESPEGVAVSTSTILAAAAEQPPSLVLGAVDGFLELTELLGRRTGELHVALASDPANPAFAPEPFSELYQRSIYQSIHGTARNALRLLERTLPTLGGEVRDDAAAVLRLSPTVDTRLRALLRGKFGGTRIRVHGDYHAGQVLYTGKDVVMIDFEGEPARPLSERRLKRSPLVDVAGMLRSFHYAAFGSILSPDLGATVRTADERILEPWVRAWYLWASASFLRGYRGATASSSLLPTDEREWEILLDAFVLQKAFYEVAYELNNRPSWLPIPLRGILELLPPP
jgi:maltose alpha-D-glucosyltransferase/alpha-amylase